MIELLLLEASANVATELALHPYLIVTVISGLFAALVATVKVLLSFFEKRMNEKFEGLEESVGQVDEHNAKQDARLEKIDEQLKSYATHVALGAKESSEIHAAIARVEAAVASHVVKEEGTTWVKIDKLGETLRDMKLANEIAHTALTTGQAALGDRVEALENKMPNGQLEKLAEAFKKLSLGGPKRKIRGQK